MPINNNNESISKHIHFDVYLGKGRGIEQLQGNRIYRQVITTNKERYRIAKGHKPKHAVARSIIEALIQRGGTFYHKDNEKSEWISAPGAVVVRKVKQALREKQKNRTRTAAHTSSSKQDEEQAKSKDGTQSMLDHHDQSDKELSFSIVLESDPVNAIMGKSFAIDEFSLDDICSITSSDGTKEDELQPSADEVQVQASTSVEEVVNDDTNVLCNVAQQFYAREGARHSPEILLLLASLFQERSIAQEESQYAVEDCQEDEEQTRDFEKRETSF